MKPQAIEENGLHARVISPEDGGHYFFGYYDLMPFDSTGRYHLCHRAEFEDRIPTAEDVCRLGVIDLQTGEFITLAETTAWNFQQGALLQWYGGDDAVIYNIRTETGFHACIHQLKTGEKKILPKPYAAMASNGALLCLNFSRLYDFRAGYGYAGIPDPYFEEKAPTEDGVFFTDPSTGETRMLFSIADLRDRFPEEPYCYAKLLVNHITFTPSGDRFVMLFRNFKNPPEIPKFNTQLLTGDLHGNCYRMAPFGYQSHYHWKNEKELLIFGGRSAADRSDAGLYLYTDESDSVLRLPEPNPKRDLHCLYSPDRRYVLGDDYPDEEGYRALHWIDTENKTDTILGKYLSYVNVGEDRQYRCDLHARFDRNGRRISFDSIHVGHRCVCLMDLDPVL